MSISEARILANRQNALKSTGPKTEEGKARSRLNALKHGLTGSGAVQPEDEIAELNRRADAWSAKLGAESDCEQWLVKQAVLASMRLDRCQRLEAAQRTLFAERSEHVWELDRQVDAEQLATRLARNPALVARQLKQSKTGCDWLLNRWELLAAALDTPTGWEDPQRSLAFDLLGIPVEERAVDPRCLEMDAEVLRQLVQTEIAKLQSLKREALDALDAAEQSLATQDQLFHVAPQARLLRRYENASRQMLFWALKQLDRLRADAPAAQAPPPAESEPAAEPSPTVKVEPSLPGFEIAPPILQTSEVLPISITGPVQQPLSRRARRRQAREARRGRR